jgi:hypothetical protein
MYLAVQVVATISGRSYTFTSPAVPVYTFPNATGGSVTAPSPAARGTYTSGKYKVGQSVVGHAWSVMGTPWPTLTYQWWVCNTSALTANPQAAAALAIPTCAIANGTGNSGIATRGGYVASNPTSIQQSTNPYDLGGYGFSYVVTSQAAGKFLTFTATLANEATTAQGSVFTFTQSRTMNSGRINSAPGLSAAPTISGTGAVGVRLTASGSTYVGTPTGKISYQWTTSSSASGTFTPITNARSATYTPILGDLDQWLKVIATATSNAGETATATSAAALQILRSQATLSIRNSVRTARFGTSITVTASGGTGGGALNYSVTGTGCSINLTTGALSATQATTCVVTASRLASAGYNVVRSATKSFTFTI